MTKARPLGTNGQPIHKLDLLILDELGYVPASKLGAELLFDVISSAYERSSTLRPGVQGTGGEKMLGNCWPVVTRPWLVGFNLPPDTRGRAWRF